VEGRAILLAHCFATRGGGSYFGEAIHAYEDLYSLPFDVFIFGHDHSDHGVVSLRAGSSPTRHFVNLGALSRGSLSRENIDRSVKCAIVEVSASKVSVQEVKLRVRPASEVFDLNLKAQKDRETQAVEEFVTQLSHSLVDSGQVSYLEKLKTMELSDDVLAKVQFYLSQAETTVV
jgi:hypothetical protein